MNWQTAVKILSGGIPAGDDQRNDAAERIAIDIDRDGDDSAWDWILNGDWTGNETFESVVEELEWLESQV